MLPCIYPLILVSSGESGCGKVAQQYQQLFELFPDLEVALPYLTVNNTRMTDFIDCVIFQLYAHIFKLGIISTCISLLLSLGTHSLFLNIF